MLYACRLSMLVYLYVTVYVSVYASVYVSVYVSVYTHTHTHTHANTHTHTHRVEKKRPCQSGHVEILDLGFRFRFKSLSTCLQAESSEASDAQHISNTLATHWQHTHLIERGEWCKLTYFTQLDLFVHDWWHLLFFYFALFFFHLYLRLSFAYLMQLNVCAHTHTDTHIHTHTNTHTHTHTPWWRNYLPLQCRGYWIE